MIPRFTGSQVRSKIALTFQRMQTINQANHAYKLEHGQFNSKPEEWKNLTTPIVYLHDWSNTLDPFYRPMNKTYDSPYEIGSLRSTPFVTNPQGGSIPISFYYHDIPSGTSEYFMHSYGPSDVPFNGNLMVKNNEAHFVGGYHLSNGLISHGLLFGTDSKLFNNF